MKIRDYIRYKMDVKYELLVYPQEIGLENMTPEQGEEYVQWFLSKIPERMEYFRNRCAEDLGISVDELDYSPESLILVWRWFLKTARMEKVPREQLVQQRKAAGVLGDSFSATKVFSVATHFIMYDIAMYVGQCFVLNYPSLHWCFCPQPEDSVTVNQPAITQFHVVIEMNLPKFRVVEADSEFYPIHMVGVQAASFYRNAQKETDLYNIFMKWAGWIVS